jgi:hypothetical protein
VGLLFILAACGHSAQPEQASTRLVRGAGFSFSVPRAWRTRRAERAVVAQRGSALVSVTTYALVKPYTPALFDRAAAELDRVAARLASEVHGTLSERATTTVDGRRIRVYRFGNASAETRIGFVLEGRREYQLLCQNRRGTNDPDRACALLFDTFTVL